MEPSIEDRLRRTFRSADDLAVDDPDSVLATAVARIRRGHRRRQAIAIAASALLIAGTAAALLQRGDGSHVVAPVVTDHPATTEVDPRLPRDPTSPQPASSAPATGVPSTTPSLPPGASAFSPIAPDPRGPSAFPTAVWAGSEILVVGGQDHDVIRQTAAAYDPARDSWRTIASPPQTPPNPIAAWTGSRLVVLADAETSYDPDSDVWTPGPPIPASFTGNSPWTWTGQVLLAWGSGMHGEDGGVWSYNPATDAVNRVADPPIAFRQLPASVWTGDEWIIWGGYSPADSTDLADGAAYNPLTNKWRIIAAAPLTARRTHAVWTGSQMIVAAGASSGDPVTGSFVFANSDGAAYDPATDTWHRIRDGFAHPGFLPVWTGREMVMFAKAGAVIYDPSSDTWTDMCCSVENGGGGGGTPVWTGSQIILVGSTGASLGGQVFTPPG